MKHIERAYLRPFPGLIKTSLYLVNIQPNLKSYPLPPKLSGSAPGNHAEICNAVEVMKVTNT